MENLNLEDFTAFADKSTCPALLPRHLRQEDNSKKIEFLKKELKQIVHSHLTGLQKDCVIKYYWQGKRNSEIAADCKISCSQVSKTLKSARECVKNQLEKTVQLYDKIEKNILSE